MMSNMSVLNSSNSIGNMTQPSLTKIDLRTLTGITITVSFVILVIGSVGNTTVLIIFGRRWRHLKNCEIFMINLAISDLLGTIVIPFSLILDLLEFDMQPFGHVGCKLISFIAITSITVSSFTLVIISIDRFIIVKWQFRPNIDSKRLVIVNITTWLLGSLFGIVYLTGDWVKLYKGDNSIHHACRSSASDRARRIHFLVTVSFQVLLPLLIITVLSLCIIDVLKANAKNTLLKNSSREYRKRARISKKAIKLVRVIVIAFFVCQIPVNLFFFAIEFKFNKLSHDATLRVYYVLHMLEISSNCINPLIYCKLHTKFRRLTVNRFLKWLMLLIGKPGERLMIDPRDNATREIIKMNTIVLTTPQITPQMSPAIVPKQTTHLLPDKK